MKYSHKFVSAGVLIFGMSWVCAGGGNSMCGVLFSFYD